MFPFCVFGLAAYVNGYTGTTSENEPVFLSLTVPTTITVTVSSFVFHVPNLIKSPDFVFEREGGKATTKSGDFIRFGT
jgi:hypothetical protein